MERMQKGDDRLVFLLPELGIVIKLPIIRIYGAWEVISARLKGGYARDLLRGTVSTKLLDGCKANWNEFWFYVTTRNPFAQPTYFSLFGLLNIQRYGAPAYSLDVFEMWEQLSELTNGDSSRTDDHHFDNRGNFTLTKAGRLRILDYGSPLTRHIVRKYGAKIYREFDPPYKKEVRH